jgi:hypothetical protein
MRVGRDSGGDARELCGERAARVREPADARERDT